MAIFLLTILCISLALAAIMLFLMVLFLLRYIKNNININDDIIIDKDIVNKFFEKYAVKKYKCNNLITFAAINDELSGCIVYDFSSFDETGNVGLIYYFSEKDLKQTFGEDVDFEDEEEMLVANYKNQTIYLLKDGSYQWDISQFL
jgi:hypothetical protein